MAGRRSRQVFRIIATYIHPHFIAAKDSLSTEVVSKSVNKPDKDENGEKMSTEPLTPFQTKLASEWVPLELNFGIPLFNETSNAAVCDRVSVCIHPGGYFIIGLHVTL